MLKDILDLTNKLKILVEESTVLSDHIRNKQFYFDDKVTEVERTNLEIEIIFENLKTISNSLDKNESGDDITRDDIGIIIKSYNQIILNIKEWKRIRRALNNLTDEQKTLILQNENYLLDIVKELKNKIEVIEEKSQNMKLKLAIKRLINYIEDECRTLL